jgi:hypothetical protein
MKRAVTLGVLASIVGCFIGCVFGPRDRERDVIRSLPWQQFDQTLEHYGQPLGSWKSR